MDLFESGYVYMGLSKYYNMDINKFAKSKILMKSAERKATTVFGKNQLLWDLGLNPALMTRKEAVMAKIKGNEIIYSNTGCRVFKPGVTKFLKNILEFCSEKLRTLHQK